MINWIASITGMIAAVIVASNISARWSGVGFLIFTASSIAWITAAILEDENPLLIQNMVLLLINIWGIYRYLIRKKPPSEA